jgi:hypothetical protein
VSPALHKQAPDHVPALPALHKLPVYYWLIAAMLIFLALVNGVVYYRKKKNSARAYAVPETAPALPVAEEQHIDIKKQLEALAGTAGTHEYITGFKKILTDFLCRQEGVSAVAEEEIIQQIQVTAPELAAAAGHLYRQCNTLLYSQGSIHAGARNEMETTLVAMALKKDAGAV